MKKFFKRSRIFGGFTSLMPQQIRTFPQSDSRNSLLRIGIRARYAFMDNEKLLPKHASNDSTRAVDLRSLFWVRYWSSQTMWNRYVLFRKSTFIELFAAICASALPCRCLFCRLRDESGLLSGPNFGSIE